MPDKSEWKKLLLEPNAPGWIALMLLVIAIGVVSILFGGAPAVKNHAQVTNAPGPSSPK